MRVGVFSEVFFSSGVTRVFVLKYLSESRVKLKYFKFYDVRKITPGIFSQRALRSATLRRFQFSSSYNSRKYGVKIRFSFSTDFFFIFFYAPGLKFLYFSEWQIPDSERFRRVWKLIKNDLTPPPSSWPW